MVKEQWDYVGKVHKPDDEPVFLYKDVYGFWINPFTGESKLILIEKRGRDDGTIW